MPQSTFNNSHAKAKPDISRIDFDSYVTFLFSILLIFLTFGFSLFYITLQCFATAKRTPFLNTKSLSRISVALVLGQKLSDKSTVGNDYKIRLDRSKQFLLASSQSKLMILGGITRKNTISEAEAGLKNLQPQLKTYPLENILLEETSQNTLENLKEARNRMDDLTSPNSFDFVGLITNRYHLNRCKVIAKGLGYSPILIAAEPKLLCSFSECIKIIKEGFYLHWYQAGKFLAHLLNSKRMLGKIHK